MNGILVLATSALAAEGAGDTSTFSIDFGPMLQTALNAIISDFGKYAMVAGAAALAVWGAPKAIQMVKKFFTALSR